MQPALVIAGKDLRQRVRDRSALVLALVAPLVIAALISFAFKSTESFHYTLGLVDEDHGPVAAGLADVLRSPELRQIISVESISSARDAATEIRNRKVAAALVIPAGFSTSVTGAAPENLQTLTSVNLPIAGQVTAAIASSFVAQVNADRLALATAAAASPATQVSALEAAVTRLQIPEQVVQRPLGARQITTVSYYGPSMALFFLFFGVSYTARGFFTDKAAGMVERMQAAPIRPFEILVGKTVSVFIFGFLSLLVIAGVTTAFFGAHWGSPIAVGVVCLAMSISVVSLTAFVIGAARTQRQADGISSMLVFGLALLGGNFVLLAQAPEVLKRLSLFTPNGWALRAFTDMSTTGGGLGTVAVPVLAILAFSAVVGVAATALAPRAVRL